MNNKKNVIQKYVLCVLLIFISIPFIKSGSLSISPKSLIIKNKGTIKIYNPSNIPITYNINYDKNKIDIWKDKGTILPKRESKIIIKNKNNNTETSKIYIESQNFLFKIDLILRKRENILKTKLTNILICGSVILGIIIFFILPKR